VKSGESAIAELVKLKKGHVEVVVGSMIYKDLAVKREHVELYLLRMPILFSWLGAWEIDAKPARRFS
jgi:hypothetical protein